MKFLKSLSLFFLIVSCSPIYVNYDYETKHDFTKYKTYNYYSDIETGLSELDTERLLTALDENMTLKGLALSSTPDFYVNITSVEYHEARSSSVGVGVGGGGGNVGGGISVNIPVGKENVNRKIVFDFVEENGIGLFWQAISEAKFDVSAKPEQREAQLKAIVNKVMEGFPPKED